MRLSGCEGGLPEVGKNGMSRAGPPAQVSLKHRIRFCIPPMMVFRSAYGVNRWEIRLGFVSTTFQYMSLNSGRNLVLRRFFKNLCGLNDLCGSLQRKGERDVLTKRVTMVGIPLQT
jgi:hypothetical protein